MKYRQPFQRIPRDLSKVKNLGADKVFPQVYGGECNKLNWKRKDFRMKCCDCGLVHRFRFNVRGEWLIIRALREHK